MKEYRKISFLTALSLISVITLGQATSTNYLYKAAPFDIDTIFKPVSNEMLYRNPSKHISLNTLNEQFVDTSQIHINQMAVPAFHQIKNKGLFGPHHVKKQMEAGMYYHPNFFSTIPQYGRTPYNTTFQPYSALPYGYSSFTIKATASPYYILPKY